MPDGGCGWSLTCHAGQIGGQIVGNWFTDLVRELCQGAAQLVAQSLTWWTEADQSSLLTTPAIGNVRSLIMPVAIIILAVSVTWQGIQTTVRRNPTPLINVGTGLWGFIAWTTLSSTVAIALYQGFIEFSHQILGPSINGFGRAVGDALLKLVSVQNGAGGSGGQVAIAFLLALFFLLISALQWLAGIARLVGVGVLLALTPVAAAGQINDSTRPWMLKVASWGLALLAYQPLAAAIYATAFQMVSHNQDLVALLGAAFIMILAVVSLPALMTFFDWGGQRFSTAGGSGGGLGALAGAGMGGAGMAQYMAGSGPATAGAGGGGQTQIAPAESGSTVDSGSGGDSASMGQHATGPNDAGTSSSGGETSAESASSSGGETASTQGSATSTAGTSAAGSAAAAGLSVVGGVAQAAEQVRSAATEETTQQPEGAVDPQQSSNSAGTTGTEDDRR